MPPTYYVHPEFGYFCPGPRARRELRVAVVSILFGMVIGAAIMTVGAGQRRWRPTAVSSNAHLKSSSSRPVAAGRQRTEPPIKDADNAKADPAEAIKPYPMRMVRVRSSKALSTCRDSARPYARNRSRPLPQARPRHENEEAAPLPAASPQAQKVKAAAQPAIPTTRRRPSATYARRPRDDRE